jgi:lipid A 3-O-deacylase
MRSPAWITQLGVTPVLRWSMSASPSTWFAEAGIGANVLLPVYRSSDKSFSTAFNVGDHLAVGRAFGASGRHELALRVQHFSKAGIKHPNPGENFVQLRHSWRYEPSGDLRVAAGR